MLRYPPWFPKLLLVVETKKNLRLQLQKWRNENCNKWRVKADRLEKKIAYLDRLEDAGSWSNELKKERVQLKQKLDETSICVERGWK